jgi:MFS family permease
MPKAASKEQVPYKFMAPLVLGTMMNPLNSTMLATSLITLCNSFKISTGSGAILVTSLYVTSTIAQPLMGRLADRFSAKRINFLGFILVLIAALIGIFSPSITWLIVSRIILGLGTSAAYPSAMTLINQKYALEGRQVPGRILGIMGVSSQVSMVLGPVLGGVLTQYFGWKGIFFINIPWVIIAMFLSYAIPNYPPVSKSNDGLFKKLDAMGILLFSGLLLSLLFLLLAKGLSLPLLATFILLLVLLIIWERKQESPFIDVRLLVNKPALSLVYIRTMATSYVLYLMLYGLPQWIEGVKNLSPENTGLMMFPLSLTAIFVGLLISKHNKPVSQNILGVIVLTIACCGLLLLNITTPVYFIILFAMVMGTADGINIIANQALLNAESPLEQKGVSFGLFRTFSYLGAILSSTQLKTLFRNNVSDQSFHHIGYYTLCSCVLLALLLVPLILRRKLIEQSIN